MQVSHVLAAAIRIDAWRTSGRALGAPPDVGLCIASSCHSVARLAPGSSTAIPGPPAANSRGWKAPVALVSWEARCTWQKACLRSREG